MTLVEWLVGRQLTIEDYEFHAERLFCKPSKRTLALAEKVLNRLDREFLDELEDWTKRNSGIQGRVRVF